MHRSTLYSFDDITIARGLFLQPLMKVFTRWTFLEGKDTRCRCLRWFSLIISCFTSVAMGITQLNLGEPYIILPLVIYVLVTYCGALSPDGMKIFSIWSTQATFFLFISVLLIFYNKAVHFYLQSINSS